MTKKMDTDVVQEKAQEFVSKGIAANEKIVEGMIEFNAAVFKNGEIVVKKMYDNYVSNVAAAFDSMKALNKSADVAEFYKTATSTMAATAERLSDQSKGMTELSGKLLKDTGEAGRQAFSKAFPAS